MACMPSSLCENISNESVARGAADSVSQNTLHTSTLKVDTLMAQPLGLE